MWYVYLLYSPSTGLTYVGIALRPHERLKEHNGKGTRGAKFTRRGRPWVLIRVETYTTKGQALRREAALKKLPRAKKLDLAGLSA